MEKVTFEPLVKNLLFSVYEPQKNNKFNVETGVFTLTQEEGREICFSTDLSVFKCKPTTLNRPP